MQITDIAARIPAGAAQLAVARVLVALGSEFDWNSDTLDGVVQAVGPCVPAGLPAVFDQDEDAIAFWQEVQDR